MPHPAPPTVPGFEGPRPQGPSFGPQQPSQPPPSIQYGPPPSAPPAPPTGPPQGFGGMPPIYTGGNAGPWGAMSGASTFGGGFGGLPSLAGAFSAARNMISGNNFATGLLGSVAGGMVGGPLGAMAGRYAANRFFGGRGQQSVPMPRAPMSDVWGPSPLMPAYLGGESQDYAQNQDPLTPYSNEAIREAAEEQMGRRGFGTYRGGSGFVTGLIGPGSLGMYEGSRMDENRAPDTSAQNQSR